jgi:hypothetical protein
MEAKAQGLLGVRFNPGPVWETPKWQGMTGDLGKQSQAWAGAGGRLQKREGVKERGGKARCCAWHPSLLCLLLLLPEDFSFSPQSRQLAIQFTPLLISLALPGPGFLGSSQRVLGSRQVFG